MPELPVTFLKDENCPACVLLTILIQKYDTEFLQWDPAVLRKEIEEDFGVKLSERQSDKIQAGIVVYTTNQFETDWVVFNNIINVFAGEPVDASEVLDPAEAEYIAGALPDVMVIRNDDSMEFSDEVKAFVGTVFYTYGCSKAPSIFPEAIMPVSVNSEGDMTEKNAALNELFDAKKASLETYLGRLRKCYVE